MIEQATQPAQEDDLDFGSSGIFWDVNSGAESEAFRTAMRRVVGGVTVITTRHKGQPWGMTVSAFTPVCMEPPTLLICVNNRTITASDISREGRFAVNLLSQAQLYLSQLCSRAGGDKYIDEYVVSSGDLPGRVVMPVLRDSIVTFDCEATDIMSVGSHLVVISAIKAILAPRSLPPLLYGEGRYLHGVAIGETATTRECNL